MTRARRTGGMLPRAAWIVVSFAACIDSSLVICEDGRACPSRTVCDDTHHRCVDPGQLAVCDGAADFVDCATPGVATGRCFDGVCLPAGCGNGFVEPEELCDDGNAVGGDGCSADCRSQERCGDGFADLGRGEQCDDGNARSHDGCSSVCAIENFAWHRHQLQPPPRIAAELAYDSARERWVVFGGAVGDTWEWDGAAWIDVTPALSPPPRVAGGMAFDARRNRVVLFGGLGDGVFNDTWEWDGVTWLQRHPVNAPTGRVFTRMAWDPHAHRIVLFGGTAFGSNPYGDTWSWDGTNWVMLADSGPPARFGQAMTTDPVRGAVVMYGGTGTGALSDTWTFDGSSWSPVQTTGVPIRDDTFGAWNAIYDPERARVMITGELNSALQTWVLDGTTWTQLVQANAPGLDNESMGYDFVRGTPFMFGGTVPAGTTSLAFYQWTAASGWGVIPIPAAISTEDASFTSDPGRGRVVLFGGKVGGELGHVREWDGTGWHDGGVGPTRARPAMAYDGVRREVLMFGGIDNNGVTTLGDLQSWNGTRWEVLTTVTGPVARYGASMTYDSVRRRVVLFGGSDTGVLGDTWEWDGMAWTQGPSGPPARRDAAMAYDVARRRVVLFGGTTDGSNHLGDLWEWDGSSWTERSAVGPSARSLHAMIYDRSRRRVVMFGGDADTSNDLTEWEWDGTSWDQLTLFHTPHLSHAAVAFDDARASIVAFDGFIEWTGRYEGSIEEACNAGIDRDGDGRSGCDDEDCASLCTPLCFESPCGQGPRCGDAACDALETDRSCPADCAASTPTCGDGYCAVNETCPGDC